MEDIKIILLKTGQQIITKLSELRTDDDKPFCFVFEVPLVVSYSPEATENDIQIAFSQWMPFSSSVAFRIPFDHVITIGDVKVGILKKYVEIVKPYYPIDGGSEPNEIESVEEKTND